MSFEKAHSNFIWISNIGTFYHQSCTTGTLLLPIEIYPRKYRQIFTDLFLTLTNRKNNNFRNQMIGQDLKFLIEMVIFERLIFKNDTNNDRSEKNS